MNLPLIIAAAESGITPGYVLGYVITFAVGAAVAWFGQSLRSSAQVQERLDEKAEAVVQEKFNALSNGLRAKIDGHDERIRRIEVAVDGLIEDRHQQELKVLNQLSAIRLLIAERGATKEQVDELTRRVGELTNQVTRMGGDR